MNDIPSTPAALIIEWQQRALSYHRLSQDMSINAPQRRIHREAARVYTECAAGLLGLAWLVVGVEEEQDKKDVEGWRIE